MQIASVRRTIASRAGTRAWLFTHLQAHGWTSTRPPTASRRTAPSSSPTRSQTSSSRSCAVRAGWLPGRLPLASIALATTLASLAAALTCRRGCRQRDPPALQPRGRRAHHHRVRHACQGGRRRPASDPPSDVARVVRRRVPWAAVPRLPAVDGHQLHRRLHLADDVLVVGVARQGEPGCPACQQRRLQAATRPEWL